MTANEVELKLMNALAGNHHFGERAEARGYAVDDAILLNDAVDDSTRCLDTPQCVGRNTNSGLVGPGDTLYVGQTQSVAFKVEGRGHALDYKGRLASAHVAALMIVELDVRVGPQLDAELEAELAVRRLHEVEIRVSVVHLARGGRH